MLSRKGAARRKRLADDVETIIAATLREKWVVPEAPPLAPVVGEIGARCEAAGLRPPSYVAVRLRAAALFTPEEIAKANPSHVRRLKPRPGYISAPRPLAVMPIPTKAPVCNGIMPPGDSGIMAPPFYEMIPPGRRVH